MKPPVSAELIKQLEILASLPIKGRPKDGYLSLWISVYELKGWMAAKGADTWAEAARSNHWKSIDQILRQAARTGDFAALDEFSRAWKALGNPDPSEAFSVGNLGGVPIQGTPKGKTQRPLTLAVLRAIEEVQEKLKRAPTRGELLDRICGFSEEPNSIDESELSRQLSWLRLASLMNGKSDLAS